MSSSSPVSRGRSSCWMAWMTNRFFSRTHVKCCIKKARHVLPHIHDGYSGPKFRPKPMVVVPFTSKLAHHSDPLHRRHRRLSLSPYFDPAVLATTRYRAPRTKDHLIIAFARSSSLICNILIAYIVTRTSTRPVYKSIVTPIR